MLLLFLNVLSLHLPASSTLIFSQKTLHIFYMKVQFTWQALVRSLSLSLSVSWVCVYHLCQIQTRQYHSPSVSWVCLHHLCQIQTRQYHCHSPSVSWVCRHHLCQIQTRQYHCRVVGEVGWLLTTLSGQSLWHTVASTSANVPVCQCACAYMCHMPDR